MHCTCFWPDEAQVHPSLSTLLTFNCFCRFLAKQRPSIVSPYTPKRMPTYGETLSTLHTPHHAIHEPHTYLPTHLHRDTEIRHTDTNCTTATDGSASAASEIEIGSIYSTMRSFARPPRSRQYICCWCDVVWDVEVGGGLPVRRHSYRGHRVWRIADRLKNDKKQLKVASRVDNSGSLIG